MTAAPALPRTGEVWPTSLAPHPPAGSKTALPPLGRRQQFARTVLVVVCVLSLAAIAELWIVSRLQHASAQEQARDELRGQLAMGTAPIAPFHSDGSPVTDGTPLAYLEIPAIGLSEVVFEGTRASVLFDGPGHRRDTPLPGQEGVSVVFGRRSTFGGPFGRIADLDPGDEVVVTTGQGRFEFSVIGVRSEGDPIPPPLTAGGARLTLASAGGNLLVPDGVVRVDADSQTQPVGGAARAVSAASLPSSEQAMAIDTRTLWALVLWLQLLIGLSVLSVWCWHRWGRIHTWIVFVPTLALVGLHVTEEAARLLPNLA